MIVSLCKLNNLPLLSSLFFAFTFHHFYVVSPFHPSTLRPPSCSCSISSSHTHLLTLCASSLSSSPPLQEQECAQASDHRCAQLEKAQRGLELQLSGLSERLEEEEACSTQLAHHRERLEAENSSLRRDLEELESALTATERDKQVGYNRLLMHSLWLSTECTKPEQREILFKQENVLDLGLLNRSAIY
jgi:septal ring factor EnvC (AmiA/AmiB activator)